MSDSNSQQEINRKAMLDAAAKAQQASNQPVQTTADGQTIGVGNNSGATGATTIVNTNSKATPPQPGQQIDNTVGTPGVTAGNKQEQNKPQSTNPGLDINAFVEQSTGAVKSADSKKQAKLERQALLTKVINSLTNIEKITYVDEETDEVKGSKIQYRPDGEGKTIYDYMQDETVQEHLGFVVPEEDNQDGGLIDKQITFYWKKPTF